MGAILGILFFVYKLARKLSFTSEDSAILALGFIFGSVFIGAASVSSGWLYAQVVTTFLLFWSFYEFYYQRRWWLIGIICGLILMTSSYCITSYNILFIGAMSDKKVQN